MAECRVCQFRGLPNIAGNGLAALRMSVPVVLLFHQECYCVLEQVVDTLLTWNFKKLTGLQFKGKGVLLFCEITVFLSLIIEAGSNRARRRKFQLVNNDSWR